MFKKVQLMFGKTIFQLVAVALAVTLVSGTAWAQDTSEETRKSRIIKKKKSKKSTSASASASDQEVKVEHKDGKVVIVTGDGEKHVIDLAELEADGNVIVRVQSEEKDGTAKSRGRAILVGPEGQQEVIFDTDAEGVLSFEFDELGGIWKSGEGGGAYQFTLDGNDFVIGINCDAADDTLKAHLKLKHGLVVKEVYEDSAAEEAGVKQHDILIRANGEDLESIENLIEVIQDAGEEEDKVKLKIVRKGDKVNVEVTPTKRENTFIENSVIDLSEVDDNIFTDRAEIQRALPGLILRQESNEDLAAEIAELREMIKQLRKEMKASDKD